jgi:RNA-directed DNA polymerase
MLIEFGRYAAGNRKERGLGKPKTFAFLGFTHICGKGRSGKFWLKRITIKKRMQAKLKAVYDELKRGRPGPFPSKDNGWPACCEDTSPTTQCQATRTRWMPSGSS